MNIMDFENADFPSLDSSVTFQHFLDVLRSPTDHWLVYRCDLISVSCVETFCYSRTRYA